MGFQKIIPWVVVLVLSSSGFSPIGAAGREKPELPDEAQHAPSILVNSWHRDKMIQVALANITGEARPVKAAIGTEEIRFEPFAGQSLSVPARSIAVVSFPVLRQKTPRGALKDSDHVSVQVDIALQVGLGNVGLVERTNRLHRAVGVKRHAEIRIAVANLTLITIG